MRRAERPRCEDPKRLRDFNEEEELEAIRRRYKLARETLVFTVPCLGRNRDFMQTYRRLLAQGWKDWHVLLAIGNIANNYRARVRGDNINIASKEDFKEMQKRYLEAMFEPEKQDDPRPAPDEFTEEKMRFALDTAIASGLLARGWVIKNPTPNFRGLRKFAASRYKYFELDVEHEPFFGGSG